MDGRPVERKLAAILSANVEGYSRLMGHDEVATVRTITESREVIASAVAAHGGRVVDAPGDNVLAEFSSVVDAVESAVEIQRELPSRNAALPVTRQMQFRIGINLGDVIVEGPRLYGDGVNIAARLDGLAEGGGVCLSGTAYDRWRESFRSAMTSSASTRSKTSRDRCASIASVSNRAPRPGCRPRHGAPTGGSSPGSSARSPSLYSSALAGGGPGTGSGVPRLQC